ncbi:MAG TPA: CusA/CzcA family heavy metal efflux RND transporter [Terracidiphilus sp.]
MIERVIEYAVRNKVAVILAACLGVAAGWYALVHSRVDALPDLGDTQVIIYTRWDRSPDLVETQVTYPLVTSLVGAPHVKSVRGVSDFGASYVYVIFDDSSDQYFARARTLEYLAGVEERLPEGAKPVLSPDANSLGWIFQYVLIDTTGRRTLADIRSYQDWRLRYQLKTVPGVADVATVGGYTRQFQVNVDPDRMRGYGVTLNQVVDAVREGNQASSARMLDFGGTEYMIRTSGYAGSLKDFGEIAVTNSGDGNPVLIKNIGEVVEGPELRRGVADWDGKGEAVSGIVVMRTGENALDVVDRVQHRLHEIQATLPEGMKVEVVYDRSQVIERTIQSTRETIIGVLVTIALIVIIFLWHFPSACIPLITMPVAVLVAVIPMRYLGVNLNVMSLAGFTIAFGELIDASIVVAEQVHKSLERWEREGRRRRMADVVLQAVKQVAPATFFALLVIAVSFIPILTLEGQEGRLFKPLVYTKTLAMLVAALMVITLDPALRLLIAEKEHFTFRPAWLCRTMNALFFGTIRPEEENPLSRALMRLYERVLGWTLRNKGSVFAGAALLVVITVPVAISLGSEFLPSMDEGAILYMPTSMPGISVSQASSVLQASDAILAQFPEVDHVLGKAGRADTASDPAPLSMLETLITLKPRSEWRRIDTWYSSWSPEWLKSVLRHVTPDTISQDELIKQMDHALAIPGFSNSWTMPIRGRLEMLNTGIRTPVGLKIFGGDPAKLDAIGQEVTAKLRGVKGTRAVYAERTNQGYFLDVIWRREELARYGVSVQQAERILSSAVGGDDVSTYVSGRERYPINVRYMRDFRSTRDALQHLLIPTAGGHNAELGELADIKAANGPSMIRDENGMLAGYVYVDLEGVSVGDYVADASKALQQVKLPEGYSTEWGGQGQAMLRVKQRLMIIVPVTLAMIVLLLLLNTKSLTKTMIVFLAVPFSSIGAVWSIYICHYNMSIAVWVGLLALLSIDAETGVFMLFYLDLAFKEATQEGRLKNWANLRGVVMYGAARRLRPKFMTFATTCLGLLPVMWSVGTGSELMKRIAAPMIGGIFTSFLLELLVYPSIYEIWRRRTVPEGWQEVAEHEQAEQAPVLV